MMPKESREILNLSIQVLSKLAKGLFFMAKWLFFNESLKKLVFNNIYGEKKKIDILFSTRVYLLSLSKFAHIYCVFFWEQSIEVKCIK